MESPSFNRDNSRFFMLFIYCILSASNSSMWTSFAAISDLTEKYFQVNTTLVNLLAIVWSIGYPIGSYLGVYFYKYIFKHKLRSTLILGGFFSAFGSAKY